MTNERPLRILALDGGGVRGLSEVLILKYLMKRLKFEAKLPEVPEPWRYFDLICGTSTGGLLALMLGRLRMVSTNNAHALIFSGLKIVRRPIQSYLPMFLEMNNLEKSFVTT